MYRKTVMAALVIGIVCFRQVEAQEGFLDERTPIQKLEANVVEMEIKVKLSKLKKLLEALAHHELDFVNMAGEMDSEQAQSLFAKTQKKIEILTEEAKTTREQMYQLAKQLPQGHPLQLTNSLNQSLNPAEAKLEILSDSRKHSATKREVPQQRMAVEVEYTKAGRITELLWGVLREEDQGSVGTDERSNLILLTGEKQWIENVRKLIETLDRGGAPILKAAESR